MNGNLFPKEISLGRGKLPVAVKIVIFDTPALQERGLQFRGQIEDDTLFYFPLVNPGVQFHSRNVPEPFDLAFLARDFSVLRKVTVHPPDGTAVAPPGTWAAVESKAGVMARWGFREGVQVPS